MSDQSYVHTETDGAAIKSWTRGVKVGDEAWDQLRNVASLPFIHKHIAVMPDVHWGLGATIGSVIPTHRAIVPAAVGVDIGCGMMAVPTPLTSKDLPDNLLGVRSAIEQAVPHGRTDNGGANDRGAWGDVPEYVVKRFHGDCDEQPFDANDCSVAGGLEKLTVEYPKLRRSAERAIKQFGTLGTGNHFIEVCLDTEDRVWVMLHSGSRGHRQRHCPSVHRTGEIGYEALVRATSRSGSRVSARGLEALPGLCLQPFFGRRRSLGPTGRS